jgi:hypothetical protein
VGYGGSRVRPVCARNLLDEKELPDEDPNDYETPEPDEDWIRDLPDESDEAVNGQSPDVSTGRSAAHRDGSSSRRATAW